MSSDDIGRAEAISEFTRALGRVTLEAGGKGLTTSEIVGCLERHIFSIFNAEKTIAEAGRGTSGS